VLRRTFLAGLFVWIPIVVTVLIFKIMFEWVDSLLGPLMTRALMAAGAPIGPDFHAPGLGIASTILIVLLTGVVTANYFGKKLLDLSEWAVSQIPILNSVYTGAKQVMDAFASAGSQSFSKVVLIQFPRKGIYSLAFVTGTGRGEVQDRTKENVVNVFLPTTPNPTSGFFLLIPREDLIELDMPVEDGIKMIISGGLVSPEYPPRTGGPDKPSVTPEGR
jgi:uncharacterized membrane protein